jgi:hypothetical protein
MKKMTTIAISAALLSAGLFALLAPQRPEAPEYLTDRLWIDHIPRGPTDLVTHLIVLENPEGPDVGGVIGRSSQWHIGIELFQRKLGKDHMRLFFPQHRRGTVVNVRTWRCEGKAPEPFDLCMEIEGRKKGEALHGNKLRLYSRHDWKTDGDELPSWATSLATVPAARAPAADDAGDATMEDATDPSLLLP